MQVLAFLEPQLAQAFPCGRGKDPEEAGVLEAGLGHIEDLRPGASCGRIAPCEVHNATQTYESLGHLEKRAVQLQEGQPRAPRHRQVHQAHRAKPQLLWRHMA